MNKKPAYYKGRIGLYLPEAIRLEIDAECAKRVDEYTQKPLTRSAFIQYIYRFWKEHNNG